MDLIFTPVVTLHNPYNVNISFHKMEVTFHNVPVAFNFMFQAGGAGGFVSQSVDPGTFESINTMSYSGSDHNGRTDKKFVINIANWSDADPLASSSAIIRPDCHEAGADPGLRTQLSPPNCVVARRMHQGELQHLGFRLGQQAHRSHQSASPRSLPASDSKPYAVTIAHMRKPGDVYPGGWTGHLFMMMRGPAQSQNFKVNGHRPVLYGIQSAKTHAYTDNVSTSKTEAAPSFAVTAKLQATATGTLVPYAKLQFDYKDDSTLKNDFRRPGLPLSTHRFPDRD